MVSVHQNIILEGKEIGENKSRLGSKFCNEGKWDNFIKPLLDQIPDDPNEMTFLELGCNAGLFLKMAKDYGFRNVYGIDEMEDAVKIGKKYRDENEYNYKIMHDSIHEEYEFAKLPVADVVLMSNFHYHLVIPAFVRLLDALKYKARYILLVSDERGRRARWKPDPRMGRTRHYFNEWTEVSTIYPIDKSKDPHPRILYSLLYKSGLRRLPINRIVKRNYGHDRREKITRDFIGKCLRYNFDVKKTRYYHSILKVARHEGSTRDIEKFCNDKKAMIRDVKSNGLKRPIFVNKELVLVDGGHRLTAMEVMGYKSVIVRIV